MPGVSPRDYAVQSGGSAYAATLSARRGFGWSSSSTDASSAQATEFQPQEKPDRGRALSQSFDDASTYFC